MSEGPMRAGSTSRSHEVVSGARANLPRDRIARVLAAVDGSDGADQAFTVAEQLARSTGAELAIVSVAPVRVNYYFGTVPEASPFVPDAELRRFYEEVGTRLRERAEREGVAAVSDGVLEGVPSTVLVSEARMRRADLLVLGARGVSASRRILLGSVSNAVATGSSSTPVLVVRGELRPGSETGTPCFDRVIAAVDGSASSTRALELGAEFCRAFGIPLRIVTVVPPPPTLGRSKSREEEARLLVEAQAVVERAKALASQHGVDDVVTEVLRGAPSDTVLDYLGEGGAHLLVVGSRGRTPSQSLFLGSVSTALLHHAPCSVLIARVAGPPAPPEHSGKRTHPSPRNRSDPS